MNIDYRMIDFRVAMLEKQLILGPEERVLDYYEVLKQYGVVKLQQYQNYQDGSEEIPVDVIAAVNINEYIELESADEILALSKLREAAEACPLFADGFSKYIHRYVDLKEERKQLQNNEMNVLRIQVLNQVRGMLAAGQKEAAKKILEQLRLMFPGDIEIEQLIQDVQ